MKTKKGALSLAAVALAGIFVAATSPAASAVGASACTTNIVNQDAWVEANGVNFRTGPGTSYPSRGLLYESDNLTVFCRTTHWVYLKTDSRTRTGLPANTYGWVYRAYAGWGYFILD